MSTRASLIYILIGALMAGYVGAHWAMAAPVEVTIERKWTGQTKRRLGTGTAHFVGTDRGEFGFFGTPFTMDSDDMYAELREGQAATVRVIDWLHGPLLADLLGRPSRPSIIAVVR